MANAIPLQSGIQGVVRGVQNNPITQNGKASATGSFQSVLSAAASAGNTVRKTASLPSRAAQYESIFDEASRTYGVSKSLLLAVAKAESNFDTNSVSHAGAQGIMQLMPGTAKTLGVKNAFDPYENIMGGAKLLRDNIKSFGSVPLALAAYNAGPGAVKKYGGVPPYKETQNYVKKIMADLGDSANRVMSHFSYNGNTSSTAALAGGASLGGDLSSSLSQTLSTMTSLSSLLSGGSQGTGGSGLSALSGLNGSGGNSLLLSGVMQSFLTGALLQGKTREAAAGDGDDSTVTIDKKSFQNLISLLSMQMMMPSRIGQIDN